MDAWAKVIEVLIKLISKVGSLMAAYFAGKKSVIVKQQKEDLEHEEQRNKELSNVIGMSDSAIADKLRKRAEAKRRRED